MTAARTAATDMPGVIVRSTGETVVSIIERYIVDRSKEGRLSHISTLPSSSDTRRLWKIKAGRYLDSPKDVTFRYDWTVEELGGGDVRVTLETRASERTILDLWILLASVAFVLSALYGIASNASPTPQGILDPLWTSILLISVLCLVAALLLNFLTSRGGLRSPFHSSETDRFLRALFEGVRDSRRASVPPSIRDH